MQIRKENMELLKSLDFLNGYENAVENGKMTEEIKKQVLEHKDVNKELLSEMIEQYDVISKERAKMCRELEKSFLIELKKIAALTPGSDDTDENWKKYLSSIGSIISEYKLKCKDLEDLESTLLLKQAFAINKYVNKRWLE